MPPGTSVSGKKRGSVNGGECYPVKRISLSSGLRLSGRKRYFCAEHWIVVVGAARVKKDEEARFRLGSKTPSVQTGAIHSSDNVGKLPLEPIGTKSVYSLRKDYMAGLKDPYLR